ncbi:MAG: sigma-70 family RNA polymerase sigma factor [Planctomycetales bacterium]|nr:sigma-70 family RNA polymerase sigma factor [Planctomycetales bacterium]
MSEVTKILRRIESGDPTSADELLPLVYRELRALATAHLKHENPGHSLQATALVHEAFLRLVEREDRDKWQSRGHFFCAAAEAMRRILVESARRKKRLKHGGGRERVELIEDALAAPESDLDLVALDAALEVFHQKYPRKAELVKLRYFAGLTIEQAAVALGIGTSTADRDWAFSKLWLFREISGNLGPHLPRK